MVTSHCHHIHRLRFVCVNRFTTVAVCTWSSSADKMHLQVLAAVKAHGAEADSELPQQAMQAEMAAFMVSKCWRSTCVSALP